MTVPDLNRDRAIAYGWIFFAAQIVLIGFLALRSHGLFGGADNSSTDFLMIYTSGVLANGGAPALVYDLPTQSALQQQIFGGPLGGFFPFYYPPIYLLICAPLALLPYLAAFALWTIGTVAFLLTALRCIVRDWRLAIALCSFPAFILNAQIGLNAALTAGLLGWGLVLLARRPILAGAALGACATSRISWCWCLLPCSPAGISGHSRGLSARSPD